MDAAPGRYGEMEQDPHGHCDWVRSSWPHASRSSRPPLNELKLKVAFIDKDLGYELRSADPFLRRGIHPRSRLRARKFLRPRMQEVRRHISFVGGRMEPLPFEKLINPETKRMQPARWTSRAKPTNPPAAT